MSGNGPRIWSGCLPHRCNRCGAWRYGLAHSGVVIGLAAGGMLLQISLFRCKRHGGRGRLDASYDLSLHDLSRRTRRRATARGWDERLASGRNARRHDRRRLKPGYRSCGYGAGYLRHLPSACECGLRHRHDGVRRSRICICLVVSRVIHVHIVVHVRDISHVRDSCIRDVDFPEIALTHSVRRSVYLTPSQRNPSQARSATESDSDGNTEIGSPEEGDQRGCVIRLHNRSAITDPDWTRRPAPPIAYVCPAAIMERRKAPRGIVDPGIAPGILPTPVPGLIRRPGSRYVVWIPHISVLTRVLPATVVIEILVADYRGRKIAGGLHVRVVLIALHRPVFKLVGLGCSLDIVTQLVRSGQVHAAALIDRKGLPAACDLGLPFSHDEKTRVSIRIDTHDVAAVLQKCERRVRSIYFKHLVLTEISDVEVHLSFRKFDLNGLIVEIQKTEARLGRHAHHGDVEVQLSLSPLIGVQVIPCGKRTVPFGRRPIVHSSRLHRNVPICVIQPCHARGRIGLRENSACEQPAKACGRGHLFCFSF